MIDVTFTINGVDFSPKLSTYEIEYELEYPKEVIALDGTEHFSRVRERPIIHFSLIPLTDAETEALYNARTSTNTIKYTDPNRDSDYTAPMRFTGSFSSVFGLRSVDGNRYYKGGVMTLRQIKPR